MRSFFTAIAKIIYYNWRNLVYYRKERAISHHRLMNLATYGEDFRRALTDASLAAVGLKTVDNDQDTVPRFILLSKRQKSWIKTVASHGFIKIGLT